MAFQEPSDKMKQHEHKAQRSSSLSSSTHQERHGLPILPTPGFVDAIASGAHYAGGLSSPHEDAEQHAAHKRTHGMHSEGDPAAQAAYNGVIRDLTEMYCGRVTAQLMERRWRKDAVLESPFTKCDGFTTIASHWHALSKLCSSSECLNTRILSATLSPNRLIYSQTQRYTLRFFGIKKTITSIVVVDLDEDFRIIQLVDQWNGQELPTRWGALWLRKLSARVTPWIFPAPMHKNE